MSKPVLYAILGVLTGVLIWTYFFLIPNIRSVTGQENKALEAKNKTLDSILVSKQIKLDSLSQTSKQWEGKFLSQISDTSTNKIKVKYVFIKEATSGLTRDESYVRFIERTNKRLREGSR